MFKFFSPFTRTSYGFLAIRLPILLLGLLLPLVSHAADGDLLLQANDAYKRKDVLTLSDYSSQLQANQYLLAPYADYWLMLLNLDTADSATVKTFIEKYKDYPFSDRIRGEWIKTLQKRGSMSEIPAFYMDYQGSDTAVRCAGLQVMALKGDDRAMQDGREIWLTGKEQPTECDGLFDVMQNNGKLTLDDLWARFRLATQANRVGLARNIGLRLGVPFSELRQLELASKNPSNSIQKRQISLSNRFGHEVNLYALDRLAKTDSSKALFAFSSIQDALTESEIAYFYGRLGQYAAMRHEAEAGDYFAKANNKLNKTEFEWQTRAAMWRGDWQGVLKSINAMPQTQQQDDAWRYWKARALKAGGKTLEANQLFVPLSRERSFYGLLAQDDVKNDVLSGTTSFYIPTDAEVKALRNTAGFARALELQNLNLTAEAKQEWAWATRGATDRQLLAAAKLAADNGWYDVSINTATKTTTEHNFDLRFPMPFREKVRINCGLYDLDEAWVYGLARQESRFITVARSGVGAAGLMQVMPATARWIAKRLGWNDYSHSQIHDTDTNVQMGTYYMRYTLDSLDGQVVMATAGYNAGPARPKRWAADQNMEAAIYTENIPFDETRGYVQKVMANAHYYTQRLGKKPITMRERLGVIPGRPGAMLMQDNSAPDGGESN